MANILDLYLAEQAAAAYIVMEASEIRQVDMRERLRIAVNEIHVLQSRDHRHRRQINELRQQRDMYLNANTQLGNENEMLNTALVTIQRQNDRYRAYASQQVAGRNIPATLLPFMTRLRNDQEQMRNVRRRLFRTEVPPAGAETTDSETEEEMLTPDMEDI